MKAYEPKDTKNENNILVRKRTILESTSEQLVDSAPVDKAPPELLKLYQDDVTIYDETQEQEYKDKYKKIIDRRFQSLVKRIEAKQQRLASLEGKYLLLKDKIAADKSKFKEWRKDQSVDIDRKSQKLQNKISRLEQLEGDLVVRKTDLVETEKNLKILQAEFIEDLEAYQADCKLKLNDIRKLKAKRKEWQTKIRDLVNQKTEVAGELVIETERVAEVKEEYIKVKKNITNKLSNLSVKRNKLYRKEKILDNQSQQLDKRIAKYDIELTELDRREVDLIRDRQTLDREIIAFSNDSNKRRSEIKELNDEYRSISSMVDKLRRTHEREKIVHGKEKAVILEAKKNIEVQKQDILKGYKSIQDQTADIKQRMKGVEASEQEQIDRKNELIKERGQFEEDQEALHQSILQYERGRTRRRTRLNNLTSSINGLQKKKATLEASYEAQGEEQAEALRIAQDGVDTAQNLQRDIEKDIKQGQRRLLRRQEALDEQVRELITRERSVDKRSQEVDNREKVVSDRYRTLESAIEEYRSQGVNVPSDVN